MRLSVLDLHHPRHFGALARHLENLGYHRLWASEHHVSNRSACPTLLVAAGSQTTKTIRLGTGAILLRVHSPFRVLEEVAVLASLCPIERLDFGLASAAPQATLAALLGYTAETSAKETYPARVAELVRLLRTEEARLLDMPGGPGAPDVWLCGQTMDSAQLAGGRGLKYSFHHHQHYNSGKSNREGREIVDCYCQSSADAGFTPEWNVVGFGSCAKRASIATAQWKTNTRPSPGLPVVRPTFIGTPSVCLEQLHALADNYGTDEVMIECLASDQGDREDAFALLAPGCRK